MDKLKQALYAADRQRRTAVLLDLPARGHTSNPEHVHTPWEGPGATREGEAE